MKALFIQWGIQMMDIPVCLREIGVEAEIYEDEISIQKYVEEEREKLSSYLKDNPCDFVITYNFVRVVSDACEERKLPYAAWVFDSPQIDLYTESALNACNYIFVFDKMQYNRMQERGIKKLFYLPLATNVNRVASMQITAEDERKYSSDISFVGMLYENNHYNKEIDKFSKEEKEALDKIIIQKAVHWGKDYSVFDTVSPEHSRELEKYVTPWKQYDIDYPYFHELYYVARKVTEIDRVCILNGLALSHQVDLYTKSNTYALQGVQVHEPVLYNEEAPKVFNLSRINLNMTMRTIETGVPQRVFDIMGAYGFVMSNWQEEAEELFVPDKEIVLFRDMEELIYKVNYYLSHEQERIEIALNGWKRVAECYSYPVALRKIVEQIKG